MFNSNYFYISRASTGIYLILKTQIKNRKDGYVLVPANICYAAALPIIYCGLKVRFFDVDEVTGNATLDFFSKRYDGDVVAAIIPHMYGNPVEDLGDIARFCRENGVLLIEDCASAMGAESDKYKLGSQGDFAVYSMGYSKTVDLGYGGLIVSECDLQAIVDAEKELPLYSGESPELSLFSKLYRVLRNNNNDTGFESAIYSAFPDIVKNELICRIDDRQREYLKDGLKSLDSIITKRRQSLLLYKKLLTGFDSCFYPFSNGSVPWRFCLLLAKKSKDKIIADCLNAGLPVSDWYPRVTPVFGDSGVYHGAEIHEQRILNFPLLISENEISKICGIIKKAL